MRYLSFCLATYLVCVSVCHAEPEGPSEYQMPDSTFVAKFGFKKTEIQKAPPAQLAPIPPFPFAMSRAKMSGWSDYVIRVDAQGDVSSVALVGYSKKEFGNGEDSVMLWRFRWSKKKEIYLLHLVYKM